MDVAGNEEFIVKVPNSSLSSDLKPGVKGHVSWNTEDCRALDFAG
jgi:putative spermidine/putrescine transport system ATP-binding protein